jgi:simple sugar transport system ATP-binding protein
MRTTSGSSSISPEAIAPPAPILALRNIRQRFGAVEALCGIDLEVRAGEVLAICGGNGAGKSSLIRVMAGAETPSAGEIRLDNRSVRFADPQAALRHGVAAIYQELALAPRLSITENLFMGGERTRPLLPGLPFPRVLDKRRMRQEARAALARLGVQLADVRRPVARLSGGQRQAVAIARALHRDARVVIMDEPTAALGVAETAEVLALIRRLRAENRAVVLISHNMADVVAVADRVAVLRSGRKVADRPLGPLTADALSHLVMTGREA